MARLFTFGCSFTQYCWPTWADILGREFNHFENWGMTGGGNHFIFNSLIECITRNKINKDDTIVIMWTDLARNDIYHTGNWQARGNLLANFLEYKTKVDFDIINDTRGLAIRDFAFIESANRILQSSGCQFKFFSMVSFTNINPIDNSFFEIPSDVTQLYQTSLNLINPSMFEIMYQNDWNSVEGASLDYFLSYDYRECIEDIKVNYDHVKGTSWPDWDQFITKKISSFNRNLINELTHFNIIDQLGQANKLKKENELKIKSIRRQVNDSNFKDYHPLPLIHLGYLQQHFNVSQKNQQWVQDIHSQILDNKFITFDRHLPRRL